MESRSRPNRNFAARDEIVASIRRSLETSAPFDAVRKDHQGDEASPAFFSAPDIPAVDRFRESLEMLGAGFLLAANEIEAAEHLEHLIKKLGATRVAISDSDVVRRIADKIADREFIENASSATLFECELGITSAQWAIAETGTLVLESERESSRLTSLVPAVHICVLQASRIRHTLGEILDLTVRQLCRTITFITGASRTSDIELTLAIGVHGPGELHVIVLADQ